jgi:peptidoglycan/LPS O-acetylase OafA/YrhL
MSGLSLSGFSRLSDENSGFIHSCRGLAALMVVATHIEQVFVAPYWSGIHAYSLILGQASVMLFFVLSGFLICKSITSRISEGDYRLLDYAAARAWRIVPPLVLSLLLTLALSLLSPAVFSSGSSHFSPERYIVADGFQIVPEELLGAALFLNGFVTHTPRVNGPLWSLSFEVWLYAIAGAAVAFRQAPRYWPVVLAFIALLGFRDMKFVAYGAVWAAGFLLCVHHNSGTKSRKLRWLVCAGVVLFGGASIEFAGCFVQSFNAVGGQAGANWHYIVAFNLFIGLLFTCVIALVLDRRSPSNELLSKSAEYSYTLYIIHFPILLFVFGVTQAVLRGSPTSRVLIGIGTFALVVCIARVTSTLVENKARLKQLLSRGFALR